MKVMRLGLIVGMTVLAAAAFAKPQWLPVFDTAYKIPAGSALSEAHCKACHTTGKELNAYGKDVDKAFKAAKAPELTAAILHKTDTLDSDKDGAKNAAEIKAGTLPGDAKSKPAKAAPAKKGKKK